MMRQMELMLLALAVIFDGVLLFVLWDRVNAAKVPAWLRSLITVLCCAHTACFFHSVLEDIQGNWVGGLQRASMFAMAAGLLVLPSTMAHGALRLYRSGALARPPYDWRYLLWYLPALLLPWAAELSYRGSTSNFLQMFTPLKWPYIGWLTVANVLSCVLLLWARKRFEAGGTRTYLVWLAWALVVMTVLAITYAAMPANSPWRPTVRLVTMLSPIFPAAMFAWYLLRKQMLPLVMERTLLYGANLLGIVLAHRILVIPLFDRVHQRWRFDLVLLEFAGIVGLILVYKPLRRRVGEALRYLLSRNVFQVRDATRQLSVELSRMARLPTNELVDVFQRSVQSAIAVRYARIELCQTQPSQPSGNRDQADVDVIYGMMCRENTSLASRDRPVTKPVAEALERLDAMWAFRIQFEQVCGIVLLGPRERCDRLAEEQLMALSLLFEQFAATVNNRQLDEQRLCAERTAMQQEKLSVLGLMAGSLAHELRNPLSSIRAIASLMQENSDYGPDNREDAQMIVGEIDRLTETTHRLLDYARPADSARQMVQPDPVIVRLLYILVHYAKQHHVQIETQLNAADAVIVGTDATLSEILFNLIRNAIEACRESGQGQVQINSSIEAQRIVLKVSDNGSGIDPEIRQALFQPFVTDKPLGTGLGLYIAAQRVRELGGTIVCNSLVPQGTEFEVRLPRQIN